MFHYVRSKTLNNDDQCQQQAIMMTSKAKLEHYQEEQKLSSDSGCFEIVVLQGYVGKLRKYIV